MSIAFSENPEFPGNKFHTLKHTKATCYFKYWPDKVLFSLTDNHSASSSVWQVKIFISQVHLK